MSVITVTTVGFGDYSPRSVPGRIFGLFWMTTSVTATGFFIASVSKIIAQEQPGAQILSAEGIDRDLFLEMDLDGNGFLSKDEFMRFILVRHHFCSKDVLRDIDEKYQEMEIGHKRSRKGVTYAMVKEAKTRALES